MTTTTHVAVRERALRHLKSGLASARIPAWELELPDGAVHRIGGAEGVPRFRIVVRTRRGMQALLSLDEAAIGYAYVTGHIDVTGEFLAALDLRTALSDSHPLRKAWRFARPLVFGRVRTDKALTGRHYDHGNDFYFSFLDPTYRLYSQALYTSDDESLEQAAENKLRYIQQACRLGAGTRVLDVGAGWGSFARFGAERGVRVTMLTISREQYAYLEDWVRRAQLEACSAVVFESVYAYSDPAPFDAVVILGVMEHLPRYHALFRRLGRLVKPNGRVYMDFSAARRKYTSSTFTHRFVFQGHHSPVLLPELLSAANASGFEPVALHNDRHSYHLTLSAWARNLEAAHGEIAQRFGEETYRVFRAYLWGGAHNMRTGQLESYRVVFQKSRGSPSAAVGL